jgi:FKBP-type peptidyl-prolyl cis-trans isomerase
MIFVPLYFKSNDMIQKKERRIKLGILVLTLVSLAACNMATKFEKQEKEQIQNFFVNNSSLNYVLKPSGLYYIETEPGTGAMPVISDSVYIRWTGMFLNGSAFASNTEATLPYAFMVGEGPIQGLDEGVQYMKVGGKALLVIPSKLAYGPTGNYYYGIPGYTPIIFEVDLLSILSPAKK